MSNTNSMLVGLGLGAVGLFAIGGFTLAVANYYKKEKALEPAPQQQQQQQQFIQAPREAEYIIGRPFFDPFRTRYGMRDIWSNRTPRVRPIVPPHFRNQRHH